MTDPLEKSVGDEWEDDGSIVRVTERIERDGATIVVMVSAPVLSDESDD